MKTVPKLQRVVTQLAHQHGVDLDRAGAYLHLQLAGHGHLVIENMGAGAHWARVRVTNYIAVHLALVADPALVVYTQYRSAAEPSAPAIAAWAPLETTDLFNGWRCFAEPDGHGGLLLYDPTGQAELACFSEQVLARNLQHHGWLEHGRRSNVPVRPWTSGEIDAGVEASPLLREESATTGAVTKVASAYQSGRHTTEGA